MRGGCLYTGIYNRSIVNTMYTNRTVDGIWNKWILTGETLNIMVLVGG